MTDMPWADLPVLDRAFLVEQTYGESALARDVLSMFEEQCAALLPVIADFGAPDQQAVAVHTLKGAAGAIGAMRLAERLSRFEAERETERVSSGALTELLEIAAATRTAAARACSTEP
jgi:HPt (histidine-containing phosphotransfer) domain-containing protein